MNEAGLAAAGAAEALLVVVMLVGTVALWHCNTHCSTVFGTVTEELAEV